MSREEAIKKKYNCVCANHSSNLASCVALTDSDPTDQRGESHKDESIAGNEGWVWCRQSLLCINICCCIWTPVLILHYYWAVPVRSAINGLKRCLVQWPTQAQPLQCLRAASLEGIWVITAAPIEWLPQTPPQCWDAVHRWMNCTPAGSALSRGQQMMNEGLQSTFEQMCLAGLEIMWSCSFARCSLWTSMEHQGPVPCCRDISQHNWHFRGCPCHMDPVQLPESRALSLTEGTYQSCTDTKYNISHQPEGEKPLPN